MSEQNRELVRRYLAEVVGGDAARAPEYVHPDIVFHSPYTPAPARGIAEFQGMIAGLRAALPDLRIVEADSVVEGDLVATRWTAVGTDTGGFAGRAPTGRGIEIPGMSFYRVQDGLIVEGWVVDDTLRMAQQLGLLEAPQPA